jgi:hypothetical protein
VPHSAHGEDGAGRDAYSVSPGSLGSRPVLVAVAFAGFRVGRDSKVATEEVSCLALEAQIGCTLNDGWDVSVPLDVSWTDSSDTFHESGQPDCLPPKDHGATKVEVGGSGWRQVVWVGC